MNTAVQSAWIFFLKLLDLNVCSISVWRPVLAEGMDLKAWIETGSLGFQSDRSGGSAAPSGPALRGVQAELGLGSIRCPCL